MAEPGEPLSDRELDVLQSVAEGASNKEAALALSISQNTVKVHLRNIYTKLGVSSRTEATTVALQKGLLQVPGIETPPALPPSQEETDPAPEPEPATGPTAVSAEVPATVSESSQHRTRLFSLAAVLGVVILIVGFFSWRMLGQTLAPTPEPYVEEYLGSTPWLTNNRPLEMGRAAMAVAAVGLNVYAIGGETADGVVNTVTVYDTTTHSWHKAPTKPTAVAGTTAAVVFGEIYVPGGRAASGQPTDVVEVYSPTNEAWKTVRPLPQPIAGGLTLSDGAFLYLFGGWNGETYLDTVYQYDPATNNWRPLPAMDHARAFASGALVTGQLYVVGGTNGESELKVCQSFDPLAETWSDCPDMLAARAGAGAAVLLNKLYVIGGGLSDDNTVTFSELYDPNSQTWQIVNTPMLDDNTNWVHMGITNVERRMYILGGRRDGQLSAENFVYALFETFLPTTAGGDNQ